MAKTYDQPKRPLEVGGPPSSLVPIRVDVASRDKEIQAIRTGLSDDGLVALDAAGPLSTRLNH